MADRFEAQGSGLGCGMLFPKRLRHTVRSQLRTAEGDNAVFPRAPSHQAKPNTRHNALSRPGAQTLQTHLHPWDSPCGAVFPRPHVPLRGLSDPCVSRREVQSAESFSR